MLFLFDEIIRIVYGQEEIDIGIESEGNSALDNSEGFELYNTQVSIKNEVIKHKKA